MRAAHKRRASGCSAAADRPRTRAIGERWGEVGKSGENGRIDIGQQCNIYAADQKRETRERAAASAFSAKRGGYKILLYPYNFLLCGNAIDLISHKFSLCWYNDLLYPIGSDQPGAPRPPSRFVHDAQFSNGPAAPAPPKIRGSGTREGHGDPAGAIFDSLFKMSKKCKNRHSHNFRQRVQNVKKVQSHNFEHISPNRPKTPPPRF